LSGSGAIGENDHARLLREVSRPEEQRLIVATIGQADSVEQVLEFPAARLAAAVGSWPEPAILASGRGFAAAGRWSLFTAFPRLVFEAAGRQWTLRDDRGGGRRGAGDPLAALASLLHRLKLGHAIGPSEAAPDACPFQGGLVGFLGYDLAPWIERLPRRSPLDSRLPDLRMALYDTAVLVDNASGQVALRAWDMTGEGLVATERRCRAWRRLLRDALHRPRAVPRSRLGALASNFDRAAYVRTVGRVLHYIAAGDVFQINLSQRFSTEGEIEPLDLFLRLCDLSPAPFAAFLRWHDLAVVSASPEWFYSTRGDRIVTRPIKGTRPRSPVPEHDRRLAAELAASPKDRAELTMIVDLERNDLGRVCRYGTVQVIDPMAVESFAQVHHLVATVEGRLRPEVAPVDVIRAVFPGGSITGAPKIRAMQIIDELEPTRRGLYTGSIGYFSRGTSGFNIAIRTMTVEGNRAAFQVGGGIVADSDPDAEYEETLHKGRGLRAALEGKEAPS
jgi:para-aminobenzoate synthetase component 1